MNRPSWDEYFFHVAAIVSSRATCPRASIGAVLVRGRHILSTGYNGPPANAPHCPNTPEHMALAHCQASLHAERNALTHATGNLLGTTLYVVGPRVVCPDCRDLLRHHGVDYRWRESVLTLDGIIREVNDWQARTFPRATPASVVEHLRREVEELVKDPYDTSELADVLFLAVGLAYELDVDLAAIVAQKLAVNKRRTWGQPDSMGVCEHIRDEVTP